MTSPILEIIIGCRAFSELCNNCIDCDNCLFGSVCMKWGEGEIETLSQLVDEIAFVSRVYEHKDSLSKALRELDKICGTNSGCSKCIFLQFSQCPKDTINTLLNDAGIKGK